MEQLDYVCRGGDNNIMWRVNESCRSSSTLASLSYTWCSGAYQCGDDKREEASTVGINLALDGLEVLPHDATRLRCTLHTQGVHLIRQNTTLRYNFGHETLVELSISQVHLTSLTH